MRQVALVVIDAIRNIVEILFLIWVQVLAPLKSVDRLKGFAKCDLITYRPRKINSAELRVGLRKDLGKEGHIANLRLFKVSSSLNPPEYFRSCRGHEFQKAFPTRATYFSRDIGFYRKPSNLSERNSF
jgi:hypothetical protein